MPSVVTGSASGLSSHDDHPVRVMCPHPRLTDDEMDDDPATPDSTLASAANSRFFLRPPVLSMTGHRRHPQLSSRYNFRVRGHLGETLLGAFPALQAETRGEDTLLRGALPDQAALYGVLAEIEALGLELVELWRLPRDLSD
jgi:hypothetical protein